MEQTKQITEREKVELLQTADMSDFYREATLNWIKIWLRSTAMLPYTMPEYRAVMIKLADELK